MMHRWMDTIEQAYSNASAHVEEPNGNMNDVEVVYCSVQRAIAL